MSRNSQCSLPKIRTGTLIALFLVFPTEAYLGALPPGPRDLYRPCRPRHGSDVQVSGKILRQAIHARFTGVSGAAGTRPGISCRVVRAATRRWDFPRPRLSVSFTRLLPATRRLVNEPTCSVRRLPENLAAHDVQWGPFSCLPLDIGAMPCKSRGEAAFFVAKRPRVRVSRMNHYFLVATI